MRAVHEPVAREVAVTPTSPSAHLKAHRERMPFATYQDRLTMIASAWDQRTTLTARREARARAADYR